MTLNPIRNPKPYKPSRLPQILGKLLEISTVVLVTLKLTGAISWTWLQVLSPVLIPLCTLGIAYSLLWVLQRLEKKKLMRNLSEPKKRIEKTTR